MRVDALTMRVDALTMRVDALTMQVDALTMQVDALTMQVDALTMRVDALTMRVNALTMRVDALTMQVDALTMQVDALRWHCNTKTKPQNATKSASSASGQSLSRAIAQGAVAKPIAPDCSHNWFIVPPHLLDIFIPILCEAAHYFDPSQPPLSKGRCRRRWGSFQYCSDKQKLETRFLKETGFLAPQLFLTEQYWGSFYASSYRIGIKQE
ncbi:MAG: hypothetical protein KME30_16000 [Iphinoe sp. HA4291-MV1]|jgi:uncharacterized protein YoxC|nr:hypothetical protein [Iphinoe sp. HA4291-MV1]